MIRVTLLSLAAILAMLVLAGCGLKESDLIGSYEGKYEAGEEVEGNVALKSILSGASQVINVTLDLKEENKFVMKLSGLPIEGDWRLEDGAVYLHAKEAVGGNLESITNGLLAGMATGVKTEMRFVVIEDGAQLIAEAEGGERGGHTFHRVGD